MIRSSNNFYWCCLTIFVLATSCVLEDDESPGPEKAFVKYYGSAGSQEITDMVINDVGNVVILGNQTLAETDANSNAWILEVDSMGNPIRENTIDIGIQFLEPDTGEYFTEEFTESIKLTSEGYLIAGSFAELRGGQTQQFNMFWARLDRELNVVDGNKLDTIRTGNYSAQGANATNVYGSDIVQTSDGDVVLS